MSFASLTISRPKNRLIYINGNYEESAGNSSGDPITVPSGGNVAETLTGDRKVDYRGQFRVGPTDTALTIALTAVVPPEQI